MEPDEEIADLPERTCILTRRKGEPETLIRFALSPDGVVTPDLKRKLPGRGVWLTADRASVEAAAKRKLFARAFKAEAATPADLPELIERLMEADALSALAIANKAGVVTLGFMKVEGAITQERRPFCCRLQMPPRTENARSGRQCCAAAAKVKQLRRFRSSALHK